MKESRILLMKLQNLLFKVCLVPALLVFEVPDIQCSKIPDASDKTVKIGLLIQENNSQAAKRGAEMAIRHANEKGGFGGKPFQLVIRSMEGPWGTGSKQAVDLIFEENVWAIMGSSDGRNAHLVEQATTKARIVFLSAWTSDPTLAQAFVPWYFSVIPTDIQQADALIEEIYNKKKLTGIATVSDNSYDSKLAMESFLKKAKSSGQADPMQLYYDTDNQDYSVLADQIIKADVRGIVLFGKPSGSLRIIQQLRQNKMNQSVFGALSLMDENELSYNDLKYYENVVLISSGNWSDSKNSAFREEYQRIYGKIPGAVAAYSFDAMSLLIEAIRSAGLDRENIQKFLTKIHFDGVTGSIRFDDKGKRMGTPDMMEIKNGIPVGVER